MSYIQQDLTPQARGDTWNLRFIIQDVSSTPIDITGNQYWITLKSSVDLLDEQAELQIGPIVAAVPDSTSGILSIVIPGGATNALEPKTYNYDVQEVTSTGTVSTLLIGKIRVKADITRTAIYNGNVNITNSIAGRALYRGDTTTTSPTEIYLDGVGGATLPIESEGVLAFDALIIGRDNTTGNACAFQLNGALKKDSTTTQIIGSVGKVILGEDSPGFDANITADDAGDALKLEVTAASTNTTKWSAEVQYTEVNF